MKSRISKPTAVTVPTRLIKQTLSRILPAKAQFKLQVGESGIGNLKVVRVITDAWKSKPVTERLERVLTAVRPELSPEQNDAILRFSILTPKELAIVCAGPTRPGTKAVSRAKAPRALKASV